MLTRLQTIDGIWLVGIGVVNLVLVLSSLYAWNIVVMTVYSNHCLSDGHTVAEYIGAVIGCLVIIALLIMTALYIGKNRRSEFIVMSNESVTKVPNRSVEHVIAGYC